MLGMEQCGSSIHDSVKRLVIFLPKSYFKIANKNLKSLKWIFSLLKMCTLNFINEMYIN